MRTPPAVEQILLRQVEILSDITAPKFPHGHRPGHRPEGRPEGRPPFPPMRHRGFLLFIIKHHEGISVADMVAHSHGHANADELNHRVAHMTEKGLIDNRDGKLYITEKGKQIAEEIKTKREEKANGLFAALTPDEKETLKGLLHKVIKSKLPPPPFRG